MAILRILLLVILLASPVQAVQNAFLSLYAKNKIFNHVLKVESYSPPATVYLALFTAEPANSGSNMTGEADYTGYNRPVITFGAASGNSITNNAQSTFNLCTAGSNDVTWWAVVDSNIPRSGHILAYGALTTPISISAGKIPYLSSGQITISFIGYTTTPSNSVITKAGDNVIMKDGTYVIHHY